MIDMKFVRDKTRKQLKANAVPMHPHLPFLDNLAVDDLRTAQELGQRIIALYSLAGLANAAAGELLEEWLKSENAWDYLSAPEQGMILNESLTSSELNELSWKQESLYALGWCVGLLDEIPWPSCESDQTNLFGLIPPETPFPEFFASLKLRRIEEIAGTLDLYYCLHAVVEHPEIWDDGDTKKQLKIPIIIERRQALEWVCEKTTPWSAISLDT